MKRLLAAMLLCLPGAVALAEPAPLTFANVQGNETLPYVMEQEPGAFQTLGAPFGGSLNGIALPIKDTAVQQAVASALDALIADGGYAKMLAK